VFCKGGAGGMRSKAHDCLGHAAVGGVVEGVVALSEVVPRGGTANVSTSLGLHLHVFIYSHILQPQGRLSTCALSVANLMRAMPFNLLPRPHDTAAQLRLCSSTPWFDAILTISLLPCHCTMRRCFIQRILHWQLDRLYSSSSE
jgi:hypothetical protein